MHLGSSLHSFRLKQQSQCRIILSHYHPQGMKRQLFCTWKTIEDFNRYEVSTMGVIRNKSTNYVLKPIDRKLEVTVSLRDNNNRYKNVRIGRAVLKTFNPHPHAKVLFAYHKDGNYKNNSLANLEWFDRKQMTSDMLNKSPCNSLRPGVAVSVSLFDDNNHVGTEEHTSIKKCKGYINRFFDVEIPPSTPIYPKQTHILRDKHPDSKKHCTVVYCDKSKYDTGVSNLNDNEIWISYVHSAARQYFVSNFGRVKSVCCKSDKELLLKQQLAFGYKKVGLYIHRKRKDVRVHSMVAEKFVQNPHNYSLIDHVNGDSTNNHATNLRWIKDAKENANNPVTLAKQINRNAVIQINLNGFEQIKLWQNAYTAANELGFRSTHILQCCYGNRKSAYGFGWQFAE